MQPRFGSLALGRAIPMTLIAMILALIAGAAVYLALPGGASAGTGSSTNPTLSASCGVDMVIVIDRSTSIDSTELAQMKTAVNGFVDAFVPATPTEIGVVQFGTEAQIVQNFTGNAGTLHSAINGIPVAGNPAQYTNWAMALNTATNMFPNRGKPQLIIFASDGNPTARFGYGALGPVDTDTNAEATMLAAAVPEANAAKGAGTRIITLGIGAGSGSSEALDVANLEAISSSDAVITTGFSTLAADLAQLADDLCGGTVTVHKILDVDGNINTTGDQTDGAGWTFNASVTSGTPNPASGQTDAGGDLNFDIDLGGDNFASVDVTETLKDGATFISASCDGGDDNGTQGANSVNGIELSADDIVSCTFYNKPATVVTPSPTPSPSPTPTTPPTQAPTPTPTTPPTQAPTPTPTTPPTQAPTPTPTTPPTQAPTPTPTTPPTQAPTPTTPPTQAPTPTEAPTATPAPTVAPASQTPVPTQAPTVAPATQTPAPTTPAPTSLAETQTPGALPVSGGAPASSGNGLSFVLMLLAGMLAITVGSGALVLARKRIR